MEEPVELKNVRYQHTDYDAALAEDEGSETAVATAPKPEPFVRRGQKVGRNDPCRAARERSTSNVMAASKPDRGRRSVFHRLGLTGNIRTRSLSLIARGSQPLASFC